MCVLTRREEIQICCNIKWTPGREWRRKEEEDAQKEGEADRVKRGEQTGKKEKNAGPRSPECIALFAVKRHTL